MDTYFGKNKFIGPLTVTKKCGRGGKSKIINTLELSDQSQIEITIECIHGQRQIRWSRRAQPCKKCAVATGVYNTCPKGRVITWGEKISKVKKGIQFTEEHKEALIHVRKEKFCALVGMNLDDFIEFPSYSGGRWRICDTVRRGIIFHWDFRLIELNEQEKEIFGLIQYSLKDLKEHLEKNFLTGMGWENYGYNGWHIDHIKPLSWFNIQSIYSVEFKKCWSLTNLQPLWKRDNFKKSNLYIG